MLNASSDGEATVGSVGLTDNVEKQPQEKKLPKSRKCQIQMRLTGWRKENMWRKFRSELCGNDEEMANAPQHSCFSLTLHIEQCDARCH